MSSDDEFGSYNPTTPKPPPAKKTAATRATRVTAPVAGPSKPAPKKNGKKVQKDAEDIEDEVVVENDVTVVDDSDEEEPQVVKPAAKNKGKAPQRRVPKTKGPVPKAKAANRTVDHADEGDAMDVDEDEVVAVEADPPAPKANARNTRTNKTTKLPSSEPPGQLREGDIALQKELERLRKEVEEVTAERDKFAQQLEEVFRVRNTDAEEALIEQAARYEARLQSQEELLKEQSKLIAATSSKKPYMLQFLSREAADEEKKELEQELARARDVTKKKDAQLAEKDQRVREAEQERDMMQAELNLEIERSKSMANKNPPPTVARAVSKRGGMSNVADPKMSAVFTLYEDLTNLLVLKVRFERSTFAGHEQKIFDCIYSTPSSETDEGTSLHFNLRSTFDVDPNADPNLPLQKQLVAKIEYSPLDLDKEHPDYIKRLGFLNEPFIFQYAQLDVFLKTIVDRLALKTEEEEQEEDAEFNQLQD
ncbi:hypothetical protein EUX98_g7141 [Antrodiella citrinella]|uniref:Monopolin complex subunit Csm1/Pcs1 C-terminal domain-containing protein n=1 Tax=Antrodiella citrinella TaxID=2447956 RepID=A0A4S4MP88_9APHY|nr:hypothetical protein EUX98_g7141 [Antrodiella citrinella]